MLNDELEKVIAPYAIRPIARNQVIAAILILIVFFAGTLLYVYNKPKTPSTRAAPVTQTGNNPLEKLQSEGLKPPDFSGLDSDDEITQLRAIWSAAELGRGAAEVEQKIAGLLTRTWRGKRRSYWCYFALNKISATPKVYQADFFESAMWLMQDTNINEREKGHIGPAIPQDLEDPSRIARAFCVDQLASLLEQNHAARLCFERMEAPVEIVVPRLGQVLLDLNASAAARTMAATLIGRFGNWPGSVEILEKGMSAEEASVRAACAYSMGAMRSTVDAYGITRGPKDHPDPERAQALLVNALTDENTEVRESAAKGLEKLVYQKVEMGAPRALNLNELAKWAQKNKHDTKAFNKIVLQITPDFIENLRSKDPAIVWNMISDLRKYGEAAEGTIDELHRLFRDSNDDFFKSHVIGTIAHLGPKAERAIPDMLPLVHSKSTSLQTALAGAFRQIGYGRKDVESALLELVKTPDNFARCWAAYALGKNGVGSEVTIKTLQKIQADDPNEHVRDGARQALMLLGKHGEAVKPPEPPPGDF